MQSTLAPTSPHARWQELDILRGFALFGVFVVNMWHSVTPPEGPLDHTAKWMIENFCWDRSWPLFAFLFGVGFTILLTRAEEKGRSVAVIHLRRVGVLLGFAFLMTIVCSGGQILARYAAVGLLLVPIRRWRTPVLLAVATGLFLMAAARIPELVLSGTVNTPEQRAAEQQRAAEAKRIRTSGTLAEVSVQQATDLYRNVFRSTFLFGATAGIGAVFVLGLIVGRSRVFVDFAAHQALFRRAFFACAAVTVCWFVASAFVQRDDSWPWLGRTLWGAFGRAAYALQALSYAAGVSLLLCQSGWKERLRILAPAGRMTLTNFFVQFLFIRLLTERFFLHLKLSPTVGLLLTIAFFALQIAASRWWLDRYRYGPLESLWRVLTYGPGARAPQTSSVRV